MKKLLKGRHIEISIVSMVVYMALVVTLFALVKTPGGGHMVPWILAIVSGILGIFLSGYILDDMWSKKHYKNFLAILIIWWVNVLMIIFSILDIAGVGANHFISTLIFVIVPITTIVTVNNIKLV